MRCEKNGLRTARNAIDIFAMPKARQPDRRLAVCERDKPARRSPCAASIRGVEQPRLASVARCRYGYYMKTLELKVARIGNSRGVRLPADALRRYAVGDSLILEERSDGLLLRPPGVAPSKLSWEETAKEMAAASEDWGDWDAVAGDGLEGAPWAAGSVAEPSERYSAPARDAATVKRYEIRWVALDPVRGGEMAKTRPAVIVSLDVLNERLNTVTVCPLTSRLHPTWRSRLPVRCGGRAAEVAVDQIRTISKSRLGDRIGRLTDAEARTLRRIITEMYGE